MYICPLCNNNSTPFYKDEFYKCSCCGISKKQTQQIELYVDHDHLTGKIRGLLCLQCNVGIGMLGDNLEGVQKAYDYLFRLRN